MSKTHDKANPKTNQKLFWKKVIISSVVAPVGDDGDNIGVVDSDDQSEKWKQKRGAVVVGSLS